MLTATIAAVLLGSALQFAAVWGMGARRPIGDEASYIIRGQSPDPFAPRLFLRPPAYPWISFLCFRGSGRLDPRLGEGRLRLLSAVFSSLTLAMTAIAGWRLGGPHLAFATTLVLALHPERIILGCHIWPDGLLATVLSALMVVSTFSLGAVSASLAGILCCVGVLTRIDFLLVPPLLITAWRVQFGAAMTTTEASFLLGPSLFALAVLSVLNHRRYRIGLPDTTWAFNLMVARAETALGAEGKFEIEQTVRDALAVWNELSSAEAARRGIGALGDLLQTPIRMARGIVRRLLILVGPDTFVRQKLLPKNGAYPDLGEQPRRWWNVSLFHASPLLIAIVLIGSATTKGLPNPVVWPSIGLLVGALLFHARTRYRVAVLPALSLTAAQFLLQVDFSFPNPAAAVATMVATGALYAVMLRIRNTNELRGGGS